MLDLQSKGAWFEIINAMWTAPQRGVLSGTLEEFSLLLGCYIDVTTALLDRFERHKICDVERFSNGIVTLRCRRMVREEITREHTRERVSKFRSKKACNASVTGDVTLKKSEVRYQKTDTDTPLPPRGGKDFQDAEIPLILRVPTFCQAWNDFKRDRKSRKKPMTTLAQELALEDCVDMGVERAVEAIRNSIVRGYTGLFEKPQSPPGINGVNGHKRTTLISS
jgi:hypothetical protein